MRKRMGEGQGREKRKESPGNILYKFFLTISFSELLLASFLF